MFSIGQSSSAYEGKHEQPHLKACGQLVQLRAIVRTRLSMKQLYRSMLHKCVFERLKPSLCLWNLDVWAHVTRACNKWHTQKKGEPQLKRIKAQQTQLALQIHKLQLWL